MVEAGFGQSPPILDASPDGHRLPTLSLRARPYFVN